MEVSGTLRNKTTTLEAPKDYIPLHVRGGFIIPTQHPNGSLNTNQSKKQPFGLIVALDDNFEALGDLFLDDGESDGNITKINFFKC